MNGNRKPAAGLSTELTGLERGTYFLRASILDQNGDPVITSQQTQFHVRAALDQFAAESAGPKRRKPPKPTPKPTPKPAGN